MSPLVTPIPTLERRRLPRASESAPAVVYRSHAALACAGRDALESHLSQRERAELLTWRDAGRRRAWLCARVAAKRLIAEHWPGELAVAHLEILSRDEQGRPNRPQVFLKSRPLACSLAISHTERGVLVGLADGWSTRVGVDLAQCGWPRDGFARLWLTSGERAWVDGSASADIASFVWAAKEALYKACHSGESFAPAAFEILPTGGASYRGNPIDGLTLRSWTVDGQVAVMASIDTRATSTIPCPHLPTGG